jgi:hypothetical protein
LSGIVGGMGGKDIETAFNYAQILFVDFISAFNTLQKHVMIDK